MSSGHRRATSRPRPASSPEPRGRGRAPGRGAPTTPRAQDTPGPLSGNGDEHTSHLHPSLHLEPLSPCSRYWAAVITVGETTHPVSGGQRPRRQPRLHVRPRGAKCQRGERTSHAREQQSPPRALAAGIGHREPGERRGSQCLHQHEGKARGARSQRPCIRQGQVRWAPNDVEAVV